MVLVLGHRGMLGHVVARFLREQGLVVAEIPDQFTVSGEEAFVRAVLDTHSAWVVNCIGLGPRQAARPNDLYTMNARLPALLADRLPRVVGLIHPSTDGVFGPAIPNRRVDEPPDATDDYGVSKRQAEAALIGDRHHVIRCSIVGPELLSGGRHLFGWLLARTGAVTGYRNQSWNGVTTYEWAKLCHRVITGTETRRLLQPGLWPATSKEELLRAIATTWGLPVIVTPADAAAPVARSLVPNVASPPLFDQLAELRAWSRLFEG